MRMVLFSRTSFVLWSLSCHVWRLSQIGRCPRACSTTRTRRRSDASRAGAGGAHGKKTRLRQRRAGTQRAAGAHARVAAHSRVLVQTTTGPPLFLKARADERAAHFSSRIRRSIWCYPPHAGHCQVPALQRQSSWWLAAGQIAGMAGTSGSLSGAGAAVGGSTAAGAPSGASVHVLFSVTGMLSETL